MTLTKDMTKKQKPPTVYNYFTTGFIMHPLSVVEKQLFLCCIDKQVIVSPATAFKTSVTHKVKKS